MNSNGNSVAQRWKFGGKEYNEELGLDWYDVSARNYDPALGRWMNIDPLAEQGRRFTPYNYSFNNPIYFVDYDGMWPDPPAWVKKGLNKVSTFIKDSSTAAGNALKDYGLEKAGNAVTTLGEATGIMVENVADLNIGVNANFKVTLGGRVAASVGGLAGIDANLGSGEMFEAGAVLSEEGFSGNLDWATKDSGDNKGFGKGDEVTFGLQTTGLLLGENGVRGGYEIGENGNKVNKWVEGLGTPVGDVKYDMDNSEVTVKNSKGINLKFGAILVGELDLEVFVEGKAKNPNK